MEVETDLAGNPSATDRPGIQIKLITLRQMLIRDMGRLPTTLLERNSRRGDGRSRMSISVLPFLIWSRNVIPKSLMHIFIRYWDFSFSCLGCQRCSKKRRVGVVLRPCEAPKVGNHQI